MVSYVHGCRAAAPDEQLAPVRGPRTADTPPPAPGRLPFTLIRREAVRAMTQTLAPATLPAAGGCRVPASTGPAQVTLWHAARITYADGHTEPTAAATATPGTS